MTGSKRKLSTLRPEYFSTLEYFWNLAQCNQVILTDHFNYSEKTISAISSPINDKNITLRIPVVHDHKINPTYKKIISYKSNWIQQHITTLKHQFHKQTYAYLYFGILKAILALKECNLSQLLYDLIKQISEWLHLQVEIHRASEVGYGTDNDQCVIDWCKTFNCDMYMNSLYVFKKKFVDKEILQQHLSVCEFKKIPDAHIFQYYKDKSVLSFLFQFGPEAGYIIKQFMPAV